jgi:hypothetical protein
VLEVRDPLLRAQHRIAASGERIRDPVPSALLQKRISCFIGRDFALPCHGSVMGLRTVAA